MRVFISGTDTDIGKTLISSWLCLHSGYGYFKPIQTGNTDTTDTETVKNLSNCQTYPEIYNFKVPASPHLAAALENQVIETSKIKLPNSKSLIIEGAGGLLVPINKKELIIDLIKKLGVPVILVVNPKLGAINHSLLSIEALRHRNIPLLGVIFNGEIYDGSSDIPLYGKTELLAEFPKLNSITERSLLNQPLSDKLKNILGVNHETKRT